MVLGRPKYERKDFPSFRALRKPDVFGQSQILEKNIITTKTIIIMKSYIVDVDITVSKRIYVNASNEEEAKRKANEFIELIPYHYTRTMDSIVGHKIIDVNEED